MTRALQALGILCMALASWAIGVATGVVLMAAGERPTAAEPPAPPRWERSL
jgi:hypothetical protein